MTLRGEIEQRLQNLNVWKRGDERAPHKPLLLLIALARLEAGEPRLMPYREVGKQLGKLLEQYGRPSKSYHPEYPFWHLQSDQIWEVPGADGYSTNSGKKSISNKELRDQDARGGLRNDVQTLLQEDAGLRRGIVAQLLARHFPDSLHSEILDAVGLSLGQVLPPPSRRDPRFREAVLEAYEFRCAVCGLDLRIGPAHFCLEAAHIRWHQADGPDEVSNGLALCVLHHKALDRGVIGVNEDRQVLVSAKLAGGAGREELFLRHEGEPLHTPYSQDMLPRLEHIEWHRREVFHEPARRE